MNRMSLSIALLLATGFSTYGAEKVLLRITAASHDSRMLTTSRLKQETIGIFAAGTSVVTTQTDYDARNIVEANGIQYTITCVGNQDPPSFLSPGAC